MILRKTHTDKINRDNIFGVESEECFQRILHTFTKDIKFSKKKTSDEKRDTGVHDRFLIVKYIWFLLLITSKTNNH